MPEKYTTQEGDMVDLICWHRYKQTAKITEIVLDTNPGLAAYGPVLPAGVVIVLPNKAPQVENNVVRLWS